MNQTRRLMSAHHLDDYYDDLLEAQEKIVKLEGWLKYLSKNYRQSIVEIEISDYIKAMEVKP